jgi:RHS repeat-associated protein
MSLRNVFVRAVVALLGLIGAGEALAERTTTFYHTDGLGSVVAATNQSGAVLWRKDFSPYGEELESSTGNEKISYTGKEHDDVTGLTYFGARYYDPEIGRFMSVDPQAFAEDNPTTFNRYAYANNNPYKYVDPDGEAINFVVKFVLDVGLNVAINYATTGSLGVGAALKDSATGILNPAKTVQKAGRLAKILAMSAEAKKTAKVSKNSRAYQGETHVYVIRDSKGVPVKIGESAQGVRKSDGASKRAEEQARQFSREKGGTYTTEIRKTFTNKDDARNYETKLIERYRRRFGEGTLPENKTNR